MLQPKRTKYRKVHKGRNTGLATTANKVSFGEFGLKSTDFARLTARQIEAARRVISRRMKRVGKVYIRVFPDKPVSKKPAETRQGSGKGAPEFWVAVVRRGRMLFAVAGVREEQAREALRLASHKLPIETRFVLREHQEQF
jgi:large subunit ribosomal protein L16